MTSLKWLKQLISFDTTSRNSNLSMIDFLANEFNDQGIEVDIINAPAESKANLLASIPASNGSLQGGIILSGHTDVVPVDGQQWDSDPFVATLIEDNVFGRGACDMKGFLAVVMSLVPKFKALKLSFPIHFAFSYDEEIGCLGAPYLIEKINQLHYHPKVCIVGEPTLMRPVIGHKGKRSYRCQIHGVAAHSSLTDQGCNAIEHAATFIAFLRQLADHYKTIGMKDDDYDVPYTTLATNLIKGGNSYNTIPSLCEFIFEFRNLASDKDSDIHNKINLFVKNELLPAMQKEQLSAEIFLDMIANAPGLDTPKTDPFVLAVQALFSEKSLSKVAYATEAGMFQQAKISTLICGPGSIEQAHRANEFVSLSQIKQCEEFLLTLMKSPLLLGAIDSIPNPP
ncbi:MAG: acetylornithine deacetylase [Legionella longbeachae]|nr:acetylornithine deacetylase [Legionella longbeachae]